MSTTRLRTAGGFSFGGLYASTGKEILMNLDKLHKDVEKFLYAPGAGSYRGDIPPTAETLLLEDFYQHDEGHPRYPKPGDLKQIPKILKKLKAKYGMPKRSIYGSVAGRDLGWQGDKMAAGFKPSFAKLRDGSWGVKVLDGDYARGTRITVTTRSGKTKTVELDRKLWSGRDRYTGERVALFTIKSSSRSQGGRRSPRGKYKCEECGEYVRPGTQCWETGLIHEGRGRMAAECSKVALLTSEVEKLSAELRKEFKVQSGLTAEEFAKKVESNLPASLQRWTKVRAHRSVGTMVVSVYFAYTESTGNVDRLNAPSIQILVQGWGKDGAAEKVKAEGIRRSDVPKFRKSSGPTEKVSKSIINWFKKKEKTLTSGEPYVSPLKGRQAGLLTEVRALTKQVQAKRVS